MLLRKKLTPLEPACFGLVRFGELLPAKEHIIGEDPGSFEGFGEGMMSSLVPLTPSEGVIAENIIAIERELIQHRRMRDMGLLQRYAREARGHRKRAFQAWLACLKQSNFLADEKASEGHLPKQSQIPPKVDYSTKIALKN